MQACQATFLHIKSATGGLAYFTSSTNLTANSLQGVLEALIHTIPQQPCSGCQGPRLAPANKICYFDRTLTVILTSPHVNTLYILM